MTMRSPDAIRNKIKEIESHRSKVPQFSAFGDDNFKIIDKELELLNLALDGGEDAVLSREDQIEEEIPSDRERERWNAQRDVLDWLFKRRARLVVD